MPQLRIKRVHRIASFGLFRDFRSSATLPDFRRYNLVYGWNYSGKTTLSRVFQSAGSGTLPRDCPGGQFELELTDGTVLTAGAPSGPLGIRVFNRDFVEENFHAGTDMTGAAAIAVIGDENQRLKSRLINLKHRAENVRARIAGDRRESARINESLDTAATNQARLVDGALGERFRRDHLTKEVDLLPQESAPQILTNEELDGMVEQWRNAGKYQALEECRESHSEFVRAVPGLGRALRSTASNQAVERLRQNPEIESWVSVGLNLHGPNTRCEFCGNQVTADRWEELAAHFSQEFRELQERLRTYRDHLDSFEVSIRKNDRRDFFPELQMRLDEVRAEIVEATTTVSENLAQLRSLVESKLANLECPIRVRLDLTAAKRLRKAVADYNGIVRAHNERVRSVQVVRLAARKAILSHYAAEYVRDSGLREKKIRMAKFSARIAKGESVLQHIQRIVASTDRAIKQTSIGPSLINGYLSMLLPGDDIQAVKLNETDFQFQRSGVLANRMSEGERTAVSFAYFLAKLEEGTTPVTELILVIDDPISSLDSNHIYALHGIMESRLASAAQLFILTHNSAFFGMTKDWMKGLDHQFIMTNRRSSPDGLPLIELIPLPRLLKQFRSDYQFTYYCLRSLDSRNAPSLEELCGVPNMVRRLLEAYLGFVFPERGGWADKLPRIISDPAKCREIKKFCDDNSHAHSLSQATEVADYVVHSKRIVRDVLDALRNHNGPHVNSLEAEFDPGRGPLP